MSLNVTIRIGGEERSLDSADAQWVQQAIRHRLDAGQRPCVETCVNADGINLRLATRNCGGGGGGRRPNAAEQRIIDLWRHFGLGDHDPNLARVWPFLIRLRAMLGLRAA